MLRQFIGRGWDVLNVGLALCAAGWAVQLFSPPPTFPTSPGYAWFARIMGEHGWAVLFTTEALAALIALRRGRWWIRAWGAFYVGAVRTVVTFGFLEANPAGTGFIPYAVFALEAYALTYWRAASDR